MMMIQNQKVSHLTKCRKPKANLLDDYFVPDENVSSDSSESDSQSRLQRRSNSPLTPVPDDVELSECEQGSYIDNQGRRRSRRDRQPVTYTHLSQLEQAMLTVVDQEIQSTYNHDFQDHIDEVCQNETFLTMSNDPDNWNFHDAWNHDSDSQQWRSAIHDELDSMKKNQVWEVVELPPGKKAIGSRWVFRHKLDSHGNIVRHKARMVARGYTQRKGVDYHDTFAPVAKLPTIRTVFALAADNGWEVHQMDAKTAFLCSPIDTEVYVQPPPGLLIGNKHKNGVLKLLKGLYGLKQSPLLWYRRLSEYLVQKGFKVSDYDSSLFIHPETQVTVVIYVDDLLVTGPTNKAIADFKQLMNDEFEMTDAGPIEFFLGIQVKRTNDAFILSQDHYLKRVLENFGFSDCVPAPTPLVQLLKRRDPLSKDDKHKPCDRENYQKAIGCLMYIMICTKPQIAFAICHLAQFCSDPNVEHQQALKRLFRYLKGTMGQGLVLGGRRSKLTNIQELRIRGKTKDQKELIAEMSPIFGFTDADHAGDTEDRKSVGAYVFYVNGSCVSWSAKKMHFVATSTMESEFMAASAAAKEAIWLRALVHSIIRTNGMSADGYFNDDKSPKPVTLFGDNMASIKVAYNAELHKKSKHIDVAFHFLRQRMNLRYLTFEYISTHHMDADFMTKPHTQKKFDEGCAALGLTNIHTTL